MTQRRVRFVRQLEGGTGARNVRDAASHEASGREHHRVARQRALGGYDLGCGHALGNASDRLDAGRRQRAVARMLEAVACGTEGANQDFAARYAHELGECGAARR